MRKYLSYYLLLQVIYNVMFSFPGTYKEEDAYVKEFWSIVGSLTDKQKQQFLKFVTSCSRPPLLGFSVSHFLSPWYDFVLVEFLDFVKKLMIILAASFVLWII